MIQLLLFSIYAIFLVALISAVDDNLTLYGDGVTGSIVEFVIIVVAITGIYLLLVIGAGSASSRNLNDKGSGNFEFSGDKEEPFLFGEWNRPFLFWTVILFCLWIFL
jgi:nucleoside recognition membrane protein YjiH